MTEGEQPAEELDSPPPERQTTPFLLLQFFIFPMAIVAVCVTVFVLFGLIAAERKTARDYLSEIRSGSSTTRWQAAYALSSLLQNGTEKAIADPRFVPEAIALFEQSGNDDPRVRQYLAVALGRLGDRRAVSPLLRFLEQAGKDTDSEAVIYATWALGKLADEKALPLLIRLASADDRGLRKTAVHSLGSFSDPGADKALEEALKDGVEDVRWNAALGLAHHGKALAAPVLLEMLDRRHLSNVEGLTPEQRQGALLQAVEAAKSLGEASLRPALEILASGDPDLKVREAAQGALARTESGKPPLQGS